MRARGLTDAHPDVIALKSQIARSRRRPTAKVICGGGGCRTPPPFVAGRDARRAAGDRQRAVGAQGAAYWRHRAHHPQQIQNPGIAAEYDRINGEYTAQKGTV